MQSQLTSRSKKQRSLQPDRAHSIGQRRDRREAVFLCAMNDPTAAGGGGADVERRVHS